MYGSGGESVKGMRAGIIAVFLFFLFAGFASGASVIGQLRIQATVPPALEFRIVHEKHGLKITKLDVKNGLF